MDIRKLLKTYKVLTQHIILNYIVPIKLKTVSVLW